MKRNLSFCLGACLLLAFAWPSQAFLFGPKGESAGEQKANIRKQREEMLAELYASNPQIKKIIRKSAGYATFTQMNVNLLLLATANGYGVVVDNKRQGKE